MPGSLAPDAVAPFLRGRFGDPYLYAIRCDSTQRALAPDLPEGAVAVCEEQAAGRGRLGRAWLAPSGTSILCSVLLRPPARRQPAELSLVGGLATAETVERALGRSAGIKWPNDVLVEGRKVAGVLAEARERAVVLGIGLNVNQAEAELPTGTPTPAASLRTVGGVERERAPLLGDLLATLEAAYDRWVAEGLAPLQAGLSARDALCGRAVRVGDTAGTARGIARDGRLVVETAAGAVHVSGGEVSVA